MKVLDIRKHGLPGNMPRQCQCCAKEAETMTVLWHYRAKSGAPVMRGTVIN